MIQLMKGDCLERMKEIPDKSVDMVLTDPPYGTTECKWDSLIDIDEMWAALKRITKPGGAIVLFCQELFEARLKLSNPEWYRYNLVWKKNTCARFPQANHRFLGQHEDIVVFSEGKCSSNAKVLTRFYPQGLSDCHKPYIDKAKDLRPGRSTRYGIQKKTGYPKSVLEFNVPKNQDRFHPTQKPVDMLEYLVKHYTLENETVLDFTMGSGSTGVACKNINRSFVGIERDDKYFEIAKERINGKTVS